MAQQSLTTDRIDRLKPRGARYAIKDAGCRGLEVRVTPHGVKTLCCVYKAQGKQRRETLGRWPGLSLTDARKKVVDILANKQAAVHTIAGLANRYLDAHRSPRDAERVFRLHINPHIGEALAARITRGQVLTLLDDVKGDGKTIARDVHKHLRAMYNWAIDYEHVGANPVARIRKKNRPELQDANNDGRKLSDAELKAIWIATEEMSYPFGVIYQLLMLTGQRRGEWGDASWREISDGTLTIPAWRYKTRRVHKVPIVPRVQRILDSIPRVGNTDYLFPTLSGKGDTVTGYSTAARICGKLSGVHTRPKDFRTTCRTRLTEKLKVAPYIAEFILGHAQGRVEGIYDLGDYEPLKKAALAKYARHVTKVVM